MPGGTGRSRPFLHCSSFKIVIRKTAWKLPLTPFINIPLAHGDSTPLRNMHRQILHQPPPFKDTESETSAVAFFEVMTDSGFHYSECFSKEFLTFFLMCHQLLLFVRGNVISGGTFSFCFLSLSQCCTQIGISASFVELSANPFTKFASGVGCQWCQNICDCVCVLHAFLWRTNQTFQLWS